MGGTSLLDLAEASEPFLRTGTHSTLGRLSSAAAGIGGWIRPASVLSSSLLWLQACNTKKIKLNRLIRLT
jgi:hypothetical protein